MNVKLIAILSVLSLLLLGVIAGEWFYAKRLHKHTLAAIKVVDKKPNQVIQVPSIALTEKPELSFSDMVERPLFIKGRRPVAETPVDPKLAIAKPSGPFNWQLNGVYTRDTGLSALLSRSVKQPKGNFRKLSKGAEIEGWVLADIQKDKVILKQGGAQKELLLHKPKPKRANPNTPPGVPDPNQMPVQASPNQPPPNGEAVPVPPPMPDMQQPPPEAQQVLPPGAEPMSPPEAGVAPEQEAMPEPEPDFQTDEFSQDASTFDDGTNEQQF